MNNKLYSIGTMYQLLTNFNNYGYFEIRIQTKVGRK